MNYNQKANEILIELLHEPHFTEAGWNSFLQEAKKKVGYCTEYLANDLQSPIKTSHDIDARLDEMKAFKKSYFEI